MTYSVLHSPVEVLSARYAYGDQPDFHAPTMLRQYLIYLQLGGRSEAVIDRRLYGIQSHDLLLLRPGQQLQFRAGPTPEAGDALGGHYHLVCQGEFVEKWWSEEKRPQQASIRPGNGLLAMFGELVQEQQKRDTHGLHTSAYLLRALLIYIDRALDARGQPQGKTSFVAYRMKEYIARHLSVPFRVTDVAKAVGLSESRASSLFKETFGQTMMLYTLDLRLSTACSHIQNPSCTLEQAAAMAGFGSYSYFHRAFQKKYGISPSEYRHARVLQARHAMRASP